MNTTAQKSDTPYLWFKSPPSVTTRPYEKGYRLHYDPVNDRIAYSNGAPYEEMGANLPFDIFCERVMAVLHLWDECYPLKLNYFLMQLYDLTQMAKPYRRKFYSELH
ncbi:hypothetical protein ACFL0S_06085 [Thermodesulfobacteriota bacterium]